MHMSPGLWQSWQKKSASLEASEVCLVLPSDSRALGAHGAQRDGEQKEREVDEPRQGEKYWKEKKRQPRWKENEKTLKLKKEWAGRAERSEAV